MVTIFSQPFLMPAGLFRKGAFPLVQALHQQREYNQRGEMM